MGQLAVVNGLTLYTIRLLRIEIPSMDGRYNQVVFCANPNGNDLVRGEETARLPELPMSLKPTES